jgi:hypothetical protein
MYYKMPDLARIGGHNKIEVPPIIINPGKDKEKTINIAEKIIRKMIEISPYHSWPSKAPKKKFLSPEKINQLARNLILKKRICLEPACLVLTMKNGCISLNVTHWLNHGNHGDPRPLGDIQYLEQAIKDTAIEVWQETREEATPEETRQFVDQLAIEAWVPSKNF